MNATNYCNDIQSMPIGRTTPSATYTRQVDFGIATRANTVVINRDGVRYLSATVYLNKRDCGGE